MASSSQCIELYTVISEVRNITLKILKKSDNKIINIIVIKNGAFGF